MIFLLLVLCMSAECCPLLGSATLQSLISPLKSLQEATQEFLSLFPEPQLLLE